MIPASVESVCIFGSVARRTADGLSDKDVLVVSGDLEQAKALSQCWQVAGWSVSAYSPQRLQAIVDAGSLFAQHLKHEGQIVADKGGWLQRTLESAMPKPSYKGDRDDTVHLATPIERFHADLALGGFVVVSDVAYVAFRNFGVTHLADRGLLTFDYDKIVELVVADYGLSKHDQALLHALRFGKAQYRGIKAAAEVRGSVSDVKRIFSRLFPHRPLGYIPAGMKRQENVIGYASLRDFEAQVIAHLGAYPTAEDLERLGIQETWKWIQRPKRYTVNVKQFACARLPDPVSSLDFSRALLPRTQQAG